MTSPASWIVPGTVRDAAIELLSWFMQHVSSDSTNPAGAVHTLGKRSASVNHATLRLDGVLAEAFCLLVAPGCRLDGVERRGGS